MRDAYVGDVGDFAKFGLLRTLLKSGKRLGIVWYYLAPAKGDDKHRIHTEYLDQLRFRGLDPHLFDTLKRLVQDGPRTVQTVEQSGLFPDETMFFREPVSYPQRAREEWFAKALERTQECDLVFLDPDIGLLPEKRRASSKSARLYALPQEVDAYLTRGQSVVFYQHRDRKPETEQLRRVFSSIPEWAIKDALALRWRSWAPRYFIIVPASGVASREIAALLPEFLNEGWGEHFAIVHASEVPRDKGMLPVVAIVQAILHYLGWLGVILGVVAFLFGNKERALELVIGGFGLILLKYVIGFIFVGIFGLHKRG